jgi:hypothetical protein
VERSATTRTLVGPVRDRPPTRRRSRLMTCVPAARSKTT